MSAFLGLQSTEAQGENTVFFIQTVLPTTAHCPCVLRTLKPAGPKDSSVFLRRNSQARLWATGLPLREPTLVDRQSLSRGSSTH